MINKLSKLIVFIIVALALILPTNSFAASIDSKSSVITPDTLLLKKEVVLNRIINVDRKAVQATLAEIDKAEKNKINLITLMSVSPLTYIDTGAAWGYIYVSSQNINCYGYASRFNLKLNPGDVYSVSGVLKTGDSVDTVASYVRSDLSRAYRSGRIISSAYDSISSNEYRIAVRVGQDSNYYDYHFMLQCSDGGWCEKHGSTPSIYDGQINPSTFSWNLYNSDGTLYKANFYNSTTIFMAVTI